MFRKRGKNLFLVCMALTLVLVFASCGLSAPRSNLRLTVVTGGLAGNWFVSGALAAEYWNRNLPGVYITSTDGGAESNTIVVADGQDAQIGMTWAPFYYHALEQKGMFEDLTERPNVKALMNWDGNFGPRSEEHTS